jgi:hypothetical protein
VRVIADANPDPAAFVPAFALAKMRDGRTARVDVTAQLGSPQCPLTLEQHLAKARGCLAFAGLEACDEALFIAMQGMATTTDAVAAIRGSGIMG